MADGSTYDFTPADNVIVGFAGGGGSSEAIRLALGRGPDLAMNHWMTAVLAHQRHFPGTEHFCADVFDMDPSAWRPGQRISFAWFSPDCTDFSKAKGAAPRSERIRGLGWSVIPWAVARRPETIMVENVEEFEQWGPVYRAGDVHPDGSPAKVGEPIQALRGRTFKRWVRRLERCGYVVEWRVVNAADFGAPTTRRRLYVIARQVGLFAVALVKAGWAASPIIWPARTHAPRAIAAALGVKPYEEMGRHIDWSRRGVSIFMTKDEAKAAGEKVNRPLVPATMRRAARGYKRYVAEAAEPYIVRITQRDWAADRLHGVDAPIPTITSAKGGEFAVVDAEVQAASYLTQQNTRDVGSSLDGPARPQTGKVHAGLVAAHLQRQFGSTVGGRDLRNPAPTVMGEGGGGKLSLISSHLESYYRTGEGSDLAEPMRAATGKHRHALASAFMEQANTGMVGHDMREPLSTIVGRGTTQRLVEAWLELEGGPVGMRARVLEFLWSHFGEPTAGEWADPAATQQGRLKFGLVVIDGVVWMVVDITLRMLTPRELAAAMGLPPGFDLSVDSEGRPVSKTAQTQMIGNMVSPPPAAALIAANCPHLMTPLAEAA